MAVQLAWNELCTCTVLWQYNWLEINSLAMMYVPLLFWTVLLMVSLVLVVTDDFVCLSVCPCVCPSVCLSVCLTFYLSICLCVFLSVFSFCFVFLPFVLTDVFELREDKHVQSYSNRKEVTEYIHHLFTNIETSSKHCTVIDINNY